MTYDVEYCNDTQNPQTGLGIEFEYPANWSISTSDITNLPAGATASIVDNVITIASFDLAANAGCADVSFEFMPE